MEHPTLRLRPKADARIRAGHAWVFANEVDGPVRGIAPGAVVDVLTATGAFLGRGYANPHGQVVVHLLGRHKRDEIESPSFFSMKLHDALAFRERMLPGRVDYRWVNAEGDGLPGLEIDRFGEWVVARWSLPGWDRRAEALAEAVMAVIPGLRGGLVRGPEGARPWFGEALPARIAVDDGGARVWVDPRDGEHTGHDFALTEARRAFGALAAGKRVLDVYAHSGAFALYALAGGAEEAVMLEKVEERCALGADANPALKVICDEAGRSLERLVGAGERFDLVVVDPPPFAKVKKNVQSAIDGYTRIHALALGLLRPGGRLLVFTRSVHVDELAFLGVLAAAGAQAGRTPRVTGTLPESVDFPLDPGVPEGRGVRGWWVSV